MNRGSMAAAALAILLLGVGAQAQSLSDQIDAVKAAQDADLARQQAAWDAQQRQMIEQQKAAALAARQQRAAANAAREKKEAEALADKKRDQDYQDQLRALTVQDKTLDVQAKRGVVARQNEYIDQELQHEAAETDVTKSEAEANRNLSLGARDYLDKGPVAK